MLLQPTAGEVKAWLSRGKKVERDLRALADEKAMVETRMKYAKSRFGKTTTRRTRTNEAQDALAEIAEYSESIDKRWLEQGKILREIEKTINKVDDAEARAVLRYRHILLLPNIYVIADKMYISPRTASRRYRAGLHAVSRILVKSKRFKAWLTSERERRLQDNG